MYRARAVLPVLFYEYNYMLVFYSTGKYNLDFSSKLSGLQMWHHFFFPNFNCDTILIYSYRYNELEVSCIAIFFGGSNWTSHVASHVVRRIHTEYQQGKASAIYLMMWLGKKSLNEFINWDERIESASDTVWFSSCIQNGKVGKVWKSTVKIWIVSLQLFRLSE